MKKALLSLSLIAVLPACAPAVQQAPVQVTNSATYTTGVVAAGADNPILAAVVAAAPTAPTTGRNRQPWRAEEIERNSVVLRSNPVSISASPVFSLNDYPQEMKWTVITSGGNTTVTATYSSAYAAAAQSIFDVLNKKFQKVN